MATARTPVGERQVRALPVIATSVFVLTIAAVIFVGRPTAPTRPTVPTHRLPSEPIPVRDVDHYVPGTPPAVVNKLNREIVRIVRLPDVIQKMSTDGSEPVGNTPEQFAAHIKSEVEKWRDLIRKTGIRTES